jgi:hypothetical protein
MQATNGSKSVSNHEEDNLTTVAFISISSCNSNQAQPAKRYM